MGKDVVADLKRDYISKLLAKGVRVDGRKFEEMRPLTIEVDYIKSAEGSARIQLGDTQVVVGIKIDKGEPFSDTPNSGVLTTNAELIPMASETFESGPPDEISIEVARVVDRGIREGHAVDLSKMVLEPGKAVWIMFVDVHVIDYDGNLFDAANIAANAAFKTAIIRGSKAGLSEDQPLPVQHQPISVTVVKIDGKILVDPTHDEERVADARLTVATLENGNLCAMQKGLNGAFTMEEVFKVVDLSRRIGADIRSRF
ncbi:MAG: RNA-binding protein [Euryarchaeota archaeon RBG_13_57_23]|nr:MAG: RNA-binding protein [Euryarchaeota archaeon RBG_13_57_23]OGS55723.1 MAG: RNA-binding protein [Euryarchaeota archaeon RBG_19FT_COMBO_56_21]